MKVKFWFISVLLVFCCVGHLSAQLKMEAENAMFTSGLNVHTAITGYSGNGYVGNFSNDTDTLKFTFDISDTGKFNIILGYSAPYGEKTNSISVNGQKIDFTIGKTNTFSEQELLSGVRLQEGKNSIEITKSWGWFYVDYVTIEEHTDADIDFSHSKQLINENATEYTVKLFQFLLDNFQKNTISGVMTGRSFDDTEWLKQQTGKEPAIAGFDFLHCNRGYNWHNNDDPINDARTWYNRNGIPTLSWHWRDPSRITEEFYTNKTAFDVSKIWDKDSDEYKAMISDIDFIAGLFKKIEDVPVLWRPLHEASGAWFWWGAKGPEACKELWQIMYKRLVNYHQINNLIWVWTTDAREDNLDWYPGDEYVDILGVDIYAEQGDFGSQYLSFDKVKNDFAGKKMVTLSECGVVPDPDKMVEDEAWWSYFMPWTGDFVRLESYNPLSHWEKVLFHEKVITLDEMPDLKNYKSTTGASEKKLNNFKLQLDKNLKIYRITPLNYAGTYNVEFYNLNGQCLYAKNNISGLSTIPLSNITNGVAILVVKWANHQQVTKVVI